MFPNYFVIQVLHFQQCDQMSEQEVADIFPKAAQIDLSK